MNLRAITQGAISVINPLQDCVVKVNGGATIDAAGRRTPSYTELQTMAQVQGLSEKDVLQLQGIEQSHSTHSVYLMGEVDALVRAQNKGGDLLVFGGQEWLVTAVLEGWPDWCRVAVVLQRDVV